MNGKKFTEAEPLQVKYGERIRLKFINDSMMAHPMHLHGMFMQLENGQPLANMPNKHTVIVPPARPSRLYSPPMSWVNGRFIVICFIT